MKIIIGLCGVARSGKDTFFKIAQSLLEKSTQLKCKQSSFAHALRNEMCETLLTNFKINPWTCTSQEKEIIRPLMVAWAIARRQQAANYWIDKIKEQLDTEHYIHFITDVRYKNEIDFIHENNGYCIYLQRMTDVGIMSPANSEELNNTVPLQNLCDVSVAWRDIANYPDECLNHVIDVLRRFNLY